MGELVPSRSSYKSTEGVVFMPHLGEGKGVSLTEQNLCSSRPAMAGLGLLIHECCGALVADIVSFVSI